MVEFWGAFIFAVLEAFILVSIEVLDPGKNMLPALLIGINIIGTLVAALLFSFSPELYEVPSHFIEYGVQITITATDFLFIFLLPNMTDSPIGKLWTRFRVVEIVAVSIFLVASILKFFFYTGLIACDMEPERAAHFFEFTGEMANSIFAFAFAFFLYLDLQARQRQHDAEL
jgi:hypothetical protein